MEEKILLWYEHVRPMVVTQVTIVTQVCADNECYLKIGSNQKEGV